MLRISRPEVPANYFKQLPYDERFLKLPAENYIDLLGVEPERPQYAILNAVNDPRFRFVTACVSRRVGKTFIANVILQLVALTPGTNVLIIAPDYNLSSISWDLQHDLLDKFEIERVRDNAKDRIIELVNGSTIRVASVGRIDSAVGRSYDLIIFDEAAIADDAGPKFNIALRPTLDKDASKCIFISTPRGDNWFREFFDRGFSEDFPDWCSVHADYKENSRASTADIEAARKTMSHAEFEQEYLANFVTFEGQVYSLKSEHIVDLSELIERVHKNRGRVDIISGLDVGFRDETAMCVIIVLPNKEDPDLNDYFIVDEYMQSARSTQYHAERINKLVEKYDLDFTYIDSAAQQTRFDLAAIYDISTINAKKSITDGIGAVGTVIDNGRLYVHEDCIECIYSLRNYKWKDNTELEKPEHTRASHMADAIRYAIYTYSLGTGGVY
jgi:phage terminase large subunit